MFGSDDPADDFSGGRLACRHYREVQTVNFPKDPIILLSFLNTQLRDNYPSLAELAGAGMVPEEELKDKMKAIGYAYDPEKNQFV